MKTTGERLAWARNRAKLSQLKLATLSGVSQGLISKIERGDQDGTGVVAEIAYHIGVTARWLATGQGEPDLTPEAQEAVRSAERQELYDKLDSFDLQQLEQALIVAAGLKAAEKNRKR